MIVMIVMIIMTIFDMIIIFVGLINILVNILVNIEKLSKYFGNDIIVTIIALIIFTYGSLENIMIIILLWFKWFKLLLNLLDTWFIFNKFCSCCCCFQWLCVRCLL